MANVLRMARFAQARKRSVYVMWLVLAALSAVVALVTNLGDEAPVPTVTVTSAVVLVVVAGLTTLTLNPSLPLERVELAIFAVLAATVMVNLALGFYLVTGEAVVLEGARAVLHWVPALYIFAYIAFEPTVAGWASVALFLGVVAITAPPVFLGASGTAYGSVPAMVQVYLAHVVALVALSFFSGVQRRLAAWQDAAHEMRLMALTDALTGLANRRWGEEQLAQELLRTARYGRSFAVLLLDIDLFKVLNDTHGHAAGDGVLVDLAQRLRQSLRATDHVVRWGGEEFLVLAPETRLDAALDLAESLRQRVAMAPMGGGHRVTVSLGVATYHPGDVTAGLVARADAALYRAKRAGRDRVEAERPRTPPPEPDAPPDPDAPPG